MVEQDRDFGLYISKCKYKGDFDLTEADAPCKDQGYVQVKEGYIESEKELVCKKCSDLIPNCQICKTSQSCDMCQIFFQEASIWDDKR